MHPIYIDIEANGYFFEADTLHCMAVARGDEPVQLYVGKDAIVPELRKICTEVLMGNGCVIGHNLLAYDLPVLARLTMLDDAKHLMHPGKGEFDVALDTLVMSRLLYPEMTTTDQTRQRKGLAVPEGRLFGKHSLAAWGQRLRIFKGDYDGGFEEYNEEMGRYCKQDVEVLRHLHQYLTRMGEQAMTDKWHELVSLECRVTQILTIQKIHGIGFDYHAAALLVDKLRKEEERLLGECAKAFPDTRKVETTFVPKRDNAKLGYKEGVPFVKVKEVPFNLASTTQVAEYFIDKGWTFTRQTPTGLPKLDLEELEAMPYPEAKTLSDLLIVRKRLAWLADGAQAVMKFAREGERGINGYTIHGDVTSIGAVTGRMAHGNPNVAQTPAVRSPYGEEIRALFRPVHMDAWQVGIDAEGIELRALAGYMAYFDGGEYAEAVVKGTKEEGTDAHTLTQKALKLDSRDTAKTWMYAYLYGAGGEKLGIISGRTGAKAKAWGTSSKRLFNKRFPAMVIMSEKINQKAKAAGAIRGLDGRRIPIRSLHSAKNTLLQSCGAIIMKWALIIFWESLVEHGYIDPYNPFMGKVFFMANVHDEWQLEVRGTKEEAVAVAELGASSIAKAGEMLGFKCPMSGSYSIGKNWLETH